jgi:8-amino-3,8-dideoxy-alpha-D-manno-octulosonate transaminase
MSRPEEAPLTTDTRGSLAIEGGVKARTTPEPPMFPGGVEIGEEEIEAAIRVLRSRRLIRFYGPYDPDGDSASEVDEFEQMFAARISIRYALGVTSCTASLITALAALGIGPGDEVIVPAYTMVATPSAVLAVGAIPIITEIDDSLTLDPAAVEANVTPYTKAIIPVHMRGMPVEMDAITAIAAKHDLRIVEDVAQAVGASYKGKICGSIGDIGCFSLQMHKIITTGEGGMLVTDDAETVFRAKCWHDSAAEFRGAGWMDPDPKIRDTFVAFPGMNFRQTELTAAIGKVQLGRLDRLLERMRKHKQILREAVRDLGRVELRRITDTGEAATNLVFFTETSATSQHIAAALEAEGVYAQVLYVDDAFDWHVYAWWRDILAKRTWNRVGYPFNMAQRDIEYSRDMCPESLDILGRAVLINVPPRLTEREVDETCEALRKTISAYA